MRDSAKNGLLERFEQDASGLRSAYWFIRASRYPIEVRRHYRQAAKEKGRLAALGYDQEAIRLYGLWLRRGNHEKLRKRFDQEFYIFC